MGFFAKKGMKKANQILTRSSFLYKDPFKNKFDPRIYFYFTAEEVFSLKPVFWLIVEINMPFMA